MSGGKIMGNQKSPRESRSEAKRFPLETNALSEKAPESTTLARAYEDDSYGPPSSDHERPSNAKGKRDPLGIAKGRKSPF